MVYATLREECEELRVALKRYDDTIHPLITFSGSGVVGFFMGMFLRRVLKFLVIIIGSFFGAVFLVIQWMQAREYPGTD